MVDGIFSSEQYLAAKKLLDAAALRHAALASNIANVETPGYKRIDISTDFETQIKTAMGENNKESLKTIKPEVVTDMASASLRADGNNVSMDRELMELSRNETEYEFLTQYLSSNLRRLESAIRTNSN